MRIIESKKTLRRIHAAGRAAIVLELMHAQMSVMSYIEEIFFGCFPEKVEQAMLETLKDVMLTYDISHDEFIGLALQVQIAHSAIGELLLEKLREAENYVYGYDDFDYDIMYSMWRAQQQQINAELALSYEEEIEAAYDRKTYGHTAAARKSERCYSIEELRGAWGHGARKQTHRCKSGRYAGQLTY